MHTCLHTQRCAHCLAHTGRHRWEMWAVLAKNAFDPPYPLLFAFYKSQQPGAEVSVGAFVLVAVGWLSPDPWLCWAAFQPGGWEWCWRALSLRLAPSKAPAPQAHGSSTSQLKGVAAQRAPSQSLMPRCAPPMPFPPSPEICPPSAWVAGRKNGCL